MKKITIKNLLLICIVANLLGSLAHAAVGDWFSRSKERSKEYVLRKVDETEQKVKEFLASLRANTNCLVRGDCPPERVRTLRAIAGAIATAAVVVTAAAIASKYAKKEDPTQGVVISGPTGEMETISRANIAKAYGIDISSEGQRETPESRFLFGVETGGDVGWNIVKQYAEFLNNRVLSAGIELASIRKHEDIKRYLEDLYNANDLLIEKAYSGVLSKLKEVYCASKLNPNSWAVEEGIRQAGNKKSQYQEGTTQRRIFTDIVNFLQNPQCGVVMSSE